MEGDKEASEPTAHPEDRDDVMFSNMAQHWLEARDTIESYANKYFSPANREKPVATSEWLQDSMSFGTRMWSLWLKGIAMMARGGRTVGPPGGG